MEPPNLFGGKMVLNENSLFEAHSQLFEAA